MFLATSSSMLSKLPVWFGRHSAKWVLQSCCTDRLNGLMYAMSHGSVVDVKPRVMNITLTQFRDAFMNDRKSFATCCGAQSCC